MADIDDSYAARALLPEGLRDDLPPWAEHEAAMVDRLMSSFAGFGYARVAPPLVEFEDSLTAFAGPERLSGMFRVLDPESRQVMAVRSDMTPQIARIATTRLADAPRPLRLSYAGHVLRVKGSQLRPARQFRQAGVELIGSDLPEADLEVILLAAEALASLGVAGLSVDLVAPTLVPAIARELGLSEEDAAQARQLLDAKDGAGLARFGDPARQVLKAVMQAGGPAETATAALRALDLGGQATAAAVRDRLVALAGRLVERAPNLKVTLDPGEVRGFEFHTGVGFAFFARGVRGELGRGGRYRAPGPGGATQSGGEDAVGFSMYLDTILRAAPAPPSEPSVYVPKDAGPEAARDLRRQGWRAVQGLEDIGEKAAEARRLGCSHLFEDGRATPLAH